MTNFKTIQEKLEQFIARYYTNELLRGSILFFAIGVLYFLITLFIEYVLWLNPFARTILFWLFIAVELGLFARFIIWPLTKLFKLQKGINYDEASKIIGKHFPEVNDKLLNVLQLQRDSDQSELLLASIEQKSLELKPIPFRMAVNLKDNLSYLKYAAIPFFILILTFLTGHFKMFTESYDRVINHKMAFEPPAPFQFFVLNEELQAIENKDFTLKVKIVGSIIPENAQIHYEGETYFLRPISPGTFEYVFPKMDTNISFFLSANRVESQLYDLELINVPTLVNFEMELNYPTHTQMKNEVLKSTGNATVPEGTQVTWQIKTRSTDNVMMYANDSIPLDLIEDGYFNISITLMSKFDYTIATSNTTLENYEKLSYQIIVIKDAYPELTVRMERDTIDSQTLYFYGQASDDYGLSKIQMIYYPVDNQNDKERQSIIASTTSDFEEFLSSFPNTLRLKEGVTYEMYFEAFDNDVLHQYKSVRSQVFSYKKLTQDEEEQKHLQEQGRTIKKLDASFEQMKVQEKQLDELSKTHKEKEELSFSDKQKLDNFIKRQKQQEQMMQNFNQKLQDNLKNFRQEEVNDSFKEDLKKRLKDNEEQLRRDEKLLKELENLQDKIQKEELVQKLDHLANQNKNKQKSLQQLLELTKRYYIAKKSEKLQRELEQLAQRQDQLSKEEGRANTKEKQNSLNSNFKEFRKELGELLKDNQELRKPLHIREDDGLEKNIQNDQQDAWEQLDKKEESQLRNDQNGVEQRQKEAQQKQQEAARKMKEMSAKMSQSMISGGEEQMQEDASMLRQILDNLLLFSFKQEDLMDQFKMIQTDHNEYGKFLRNQSNLREHFNHVEDSLFALSLRQPKLSEHVNSKITDVYFYIDKSLAELSENLLNQGVSSQQYAITSTNDLASVLSDILDQMESELNPGAGEGSGKGRGQGGGGDGQQLPDIIMSQEALNKRMEERLKNADAGNSEGEKNESGDTEEGNESGKDGKGNAGEGGEGNSENMNGELYQIYQEQQRLRQALEDKIKDLGKSIQGQTLLMDMEQIESELINNGITNATLQRMMNLKHQMLKFEEATFLQGEHNERESISSKKDFNNTTNNPLPNAKEYFNTTEILNRQALPLQKVYKKKVQEYFKREDD